MSWLAAGVARWQVLDERVEAAILRDEVLDHPGVAVRLDDGVAAASLLAVSRLPRTLHVLGGGVVDTVAVGVLGPHSYGLRTQGPAVTRLLNTRGLLKR